MVSCLDGYPWSSHHYYFSETCPGWMDINLVLPAIHHKTTLFYKDFINRPVDRQQWKPGLYLSPSGEIIIDQDVVRDLHPTLNNLGRKIKKTLLELDFVSKAVCWYLNIQFNQLMEESLDRKTSQ